MDMACALCGSEKQAEFGAETNIHFPGLKGLDMPAVWVFPSLTVCFSCGAAQFVLPETELRILQNGVAH
jgi:hypothetical protein